MPDLAAVTYPAITENPDYESQMICILVPFSHETEDPTNPEIYFHFEEDQGWTNYGAEFVIEETPFADASLMFFPFTPWRRYTKYGHFWEDQ